MTKSKESHIIIQPNHVSTAKYRYTSIEKNIMYHIIDKLQEVMSKDPFEVYKEQKIILELRQLDKNNNYNNVRRAVKSMAKKPVEFDIVIPKENKIRKNLSFLIAAVEYEVRSKYITLVIPSTACDFFCYVGGGFTAFQKTVSLSLNSIHSKVLYELCCRWVDRGGFNSDLISFRGYLQIEGKYSQIAHLRNKVLNVAKKELQEKADLCFNYSLEKRGGKKYDYINIKIFSNKKIEDREIIVNEEHYNYVYRFLLLFYPNHIDNSALLYTNQISNKGFLDKAYSRFIRLDDDLTSNKKDKSDIFNLLRFVILKELGISSP